MKIVSTVGLTPEHRKIIQDAAGDAELDDRECRSQAEITALAGNGGCDVLFSFRAPDDLMKNSPQLKWIQLLSAGADHLLRGQVAERTDVAVTTASGIHSVAIAEYTIGSMLAFAHGFHITSRSQFRREWKRDNFMRTLESTRGKTLGVIGYGSIGRETARIAQALGMDVFALKRDPAAHADPGWNPPGVGDSEGIIPKRFYGPGECAAILRESDYITVTLPLTATTRKFIGRREIAAMRPHAYIVNIGRGEVIDQDELIEALKGKRIGGAGLDVFEREPLESESALWDIETAILTPHMSGAHRDYNTNACHLFADNLRRFRAGQPLYNLVDRGLGY
ncbi:MAG: D-2-hydroxyacid dehydrogenase [Candidatus Binataceae bacterium]